MTRYFVAANFWLALAFLVYIGRTFERGDPTYYSFFHLGGWLSPDAYSFMNLALLAVAGAFFRLTWTTRASPK